MKHIRTVVAVAAVAVGIVVAGATQASARAVDPPGANQDPGVVAQPPGPAIPIDDTANELRQASAAAIGGSALTLVAVWLYRRRNPGDAYRDEAYRDEAYRDEAYRD